MLSSPSLKTFFLAKNFVLLVVPALLWILISSIAGSLGRLHIQFHEYQQRGEKLSRLKSALLFHRNHLVKTNAIQNYNARDLSVEEKGFARILAEISDDQLSLSVTEYLTRAKAARVNGNISLPDLLAIQKKFDLVESYIGKMDMRLINGMKALGDTIGSQAERVESRTNLLLLSLLVFVVVVPFAVRKAIFLPIRSLLAAIQSFERGQPLVTTNATGLREFSELSAAFERAAEQISSQRQDQMIFLASVAHDLKNPITAINLSCELEMRKSPENLRMQTIHRQILHMNRLVNDLLEVGKVEGGNLELSLKSVDLAEVLAESVNLFRDVVTKHAFEVRVPNDPMVVRCDLTRMSQVFVNVISNAIKYSPEGGSVMIDARKGGGFFRITFKDSGIGIDAEELDGIFYPFRRAKSTKRSDIPGIGLGLSTVRKILRAHGGEIFASSELGSGSTFTVSVPAAS